MKRSVRSIGTLFLALSALILLNAIPWSASAQDRPARPDSPAGGQDSAQVSARSGGAALVFRGDTLGFVYGRLGPFSAAERAAALAERLARIRAQGLRDDDVQVVQEGGDPEVWADELIVMAVTAQDAQGLEATQAEAAEIYAQMVREALSSSIFTGTLREMTFGTLWTILATFSFWVALRLIGRWYPRLYRRIRDIQEDRLPSLRFQGLVLLTGQRIERTLLVLARTSRWAISGVLLVLYLALVFSFFPATRVLAERIARLSFEPLAVAGTAVLAYLPNLFYIALIAILTHYALKVMGLIASAVESGAIHIPGFYPDWAKPTYQLLRVMVLAFALVLIWPHLPQSNSTAFRGVAAFLGLLVTFGSAGAVSNVVSGVVMIYMRPFQIGDRVRIADTMGDVVERGMLMTRIRTIKNEDITIPNSMVLASHIVNYSAMANDTGVVLHTTLTIGYDAPWRTVHEVMIAAASRTESILHDPTPFVLQTALGDYAVSYELNAHTRSASRMAAIYSELHENLQDTFAEAGIEILSPVYEAQRDGGRSTIPAPHTPPQEPGRPGRGTDSGEPVSEVPGRSR